jgi:tetraacyldisaccharide 4'-kinase
MRAPDFWHQSPGLIAGLLSPVGAALDAAGRLRRAVTRPYKAPVPVICVGNLVAGGSGKTPVVLSLARILAAEAVAVHIVMRGYGGRLAGPVRVEHAVHDAIAVGDEALLAAAVAPCWVARDRAAGVCAAAENGAAAILLDDGFQNPSVDKDLSIVVVDAAYGFGNGRLMPAGPLRERVADGLARADLVVAIGDDAGTVGIPAAALHASLEPTNGDRFSGAPVIAFAGIGRPGKFFASLRGTGAVLVGEHAFPDHHRFGERELAPLRQAATAACARLVTTAKDWVRLPPPERVGIEMLEVELRWRDEADLRRRLAPLYSPPR